VAELRIFYKCPFVIDKSENPSKVGTIIFKIMNST